LSLSKGQADIRAHAVPDQYRSC